MKPQRWKTIEQLFHEALELPSADRDVFLHERLSGDPALRGEVESLILAHHEADHQIDRAFRSALEQVPRDPRTPRRTEIGPYRLLRLLGRGGLSEVYLAERADRQLERQVAIKLIRRGLDSEDILDRLRQERQILAHLDHPNIAELFDGDTTEDGLPYFVMEYIDGEPIDRYCDRHRLGVRRRLEVFLLVCSAVRYAHQKLVIHRDLKPDNILVTREGLAKLLDFGIAKLLDASSVPSQAATTLMGMRFLTPEYSSPEQARGLPLGTVTDVYSLGVVLYQLLTGQLPYELPSRRAQEVERVIREAEPAAPSSKAARASPEVAALRQHRPESLQRRLAGDLDNIILTALAKNPEDRYGSVEQLAADLERHLESRPITARRPTLLYRCRKFVRRHRLGVVAAAMITFSTLSGLITALVLADLAAEQRDRAEALAEATARERDRAEEARIKAQDVSDFLTDVFKVVDPGEALGNTITAREILDRSAEGIVRDLESSPEYKAQLMDVIGRVYQNLGLYNEAAHFLEEALAIREGRPTPDLVDSLNHLAELRSDQGRAREAAALARRARGLLARMAAPQDPRWGATLHQFARALALLERFEEALGVYEEALTLRRGRLREEPLAFADTLNDQGTAYFRLEECHEAEALFQRSWEIRRQKLPEKHPDRITSLNNLAAVADCQGHYEDAEKRFRQVIELRLRVLGPEHPHLALALGNLAIVLQEQGKLVEAEAVYFEALQLNRRLFGEIHRDVAKNLYDLGRLFFQQRNHEKAQRYYRDALVLRRRLGSHPLEIAQSLLSLAAVLERQGQRSQTEKHYREAIALFRKHPDPGLRWISFGLLPFGRFLHDSGRSMEAEALLREAVRNRRQAGFRPWEIAEAENILGACLAALGRVEEAEALLIRSTRVLEEAEGPSPELVEMARQRLQLL